MPASARWRRPAYALVAGGAGAFLLMAHDARLAIGVPLGAMLIVVCTCGALGLLGAVERGQPVDTERVNARDLLRPAVVASLGAASSIASLAAAVHSLLPQALAGLLLASSWIATAAGIFTLGVALGPLRRDESGRCQPLVRRHGFWLVAVASVLYAPALGAGSLTDPWETHYGEVAREILARDDWISLWWSWQGFFYSKPVLSIWLQSFAMATIGVHVGPDRMLLGAFGRLAHPEWAVRAPFALSAILGGYGLYKGVARWTGRRSAVVGSIALVTSPLWFLVAHQSMTDMPYVAATSGAVGLALLAADESEEAKATRYRVEFGRAAFEFDLRHLVYGVVLVAVLPQILYLLSRNVELVLHAEGPHGFRPHLDEVRVGSGLGNCRQPGDPPCSTLRPVGAFEPWMQALVWTALLASVLATGWRERGRKRLIYLGAWLLAALATMAKGPAGVVLPVAGVFVWLAATRRWRELASARLAAGPLIVLLVVGPWCVAEFVRHGSAFTDELIFHDMYSRAFDHVHDTNAGADTSFVYYVQQLGYGLFPWSALAAIGVFTAGACAPQDGVSPASPRSADDRANDASALLLVWFVLAFALFAAIGTKFHHYILPAVPPAAMLAGLALDRYWEAPRSITLHARTILGATAIAAAPLVPLVAADLVAKDAGGRLEGPARLMWLFTYRYDRPWPASLDLRSPMVAVALAATVLLLALVLPHVRRAAVSGWIALAIAWTAWVLDAYLPAATPHWGQRAVMAAYYAQRAGPQEPIASYQMNWKGENFYTGNRIAQFGTPSTPQGTPSFSDWIREQRARGTSVLYVVTEQNRVAGLRRDLAPKELHEVTTPADCAQFVLVRAEL